MKNRITERDFAELSRARSWCELSRTNLRHNIQQINQSIPQGVKKIAVIKADAYGHGQKWVAREVLSQGFDYLAVATVGEAMQLREEKIKEPILLLSPYHQGFLHFLIDYEITQTMSSFYEIQMLEADLRALRADAATKDHLSQKVKVHLKIDSGMNRIGFSVSEQDYAETLDQIQAFARNPQIEPEGIFTHFANADEPADPFTGLQFSRFTKVIADLAQKGIHFSIHHCANSAAAWFFPEMCLDAVRIGISMYGCSPNPEMKAALDLKPVMSFYSRISAIHKARAGEPVGYGLTYHCRRDTLIATIEAGYADGLDRHLSNQAYALVNGQKAAMIGRICMDRTMLDITDIEQVKVGDRALIFGLDRENHLIDIDDLAGKAGTISYDLLCGVSKRIPRVIIS